jgi:hypothetical protein
MSRRHNKPRNKSRKASKKGETQHSSGSGSNRRGSSTFQLPRHRTVPKPPAQKPAPRSATTPLPPPLSSPPPHDAAVVTVDIRYAARHYRVHLPPPGEGVPKDGKLELVAWDGEDRMCWEHVCPRVLFPGGGGGVRRENTTATTITAAMEFQWEPELSEMERRAAELNAKMGR